MVRLTVARGAAVVLACLPAVVLGQQKPAVKDATSAKAAPPAKVTPPPAKAAPKAAVKGPPRGPIEKIDCKVGTEDQHARIALFAQGGEVQSVAYYSKWKPRTCSVHIERGDAYSKWKDSGTDTTVSTAYGDFLIHVSRGAYQFFFRDVDRMHYCGMMGKLNGSITVMRGPKLQCEVTGIMDRNETEALDEKVEPSPVAEVPVSPIPQSNAPD